MTTSPMRPHRRAMEPAALRQLTSFLTCRLLSPSSCPPHAALLPTASAHEQASCYRSRPEQPGQRASSPAGAERTGAERTDYAALRARFTAPSPVVFPAGRDSELFSFRDLVLGWSSSPGLLRHPRIADAARECLDSLDGTLCTLEAYVILPTHAHLLFRQDIGLLHGPTPEQVAAVFKMSVEQRAREYLGRGGPFWEQQDFHRYLRTPADRAAALDFIRSAPVRGGLVDRADAWEWLFVTNSI